MKVLRDVWILDKSGIVLFNRVFDEMDSPQLYGAMMSALNMFAGQLTEGGLSNFELNNKRFALIERNRLIFIANSSKIINRKKINKELEKVSKKFLIKYSDQLKYYKGQIGAFSNFKEIIKDVLEETTEKI